MPAKDGDHPPYLYAVPFADEADSHHWVDSANTFLVRAERLLARVGAGESPDWPADDATRIAGFVSRYVSGVALAVVVTPDDIPHRDQDTFERKEWRLLRARWAQLKAVRKRLCDPSFLAAVFSGQVDASPAEAKAIVVVLNEFVRRTRAWLRNHREYQDQL